jgi:hypothetical protein
MKTFALFVSLCALLAGTGVAQSSAACQVGDDADYTKQIHEFTTESFF